ncbi:MAG: SGNH/GDSL hydrolase family protein [bacterium]|nr:SGNH/GDSL hydrolase family protein [bacterium]MDD3625429.1 SGNH/GDSL hydrolase family protein [Proteiniphilum sp.]
MNRTRKHFFSIIMLLIGSALTLQSQTSWHDGNLFPLLGKTCDSTETRYERLPASLKEVSRPPVWHLGKNSSGLALRFRSNSTRISARWELREDVNMNHMTDTGIKGVDLYAWNGQHWQFVNSGRPNGKENEQVIISGMTPLEREYMLYLPLYDGVTGISIGVDSTATITTPVVPFPSRRNPVICYGTSITQGGCATRAGMSYTNILGRMMNREVINLGFSGNGQLDYEIAELMSRRTDAGLYLLDFIPNVNLQQIKEKTARFVEILCQQNREIPVLLVESITFPHSFYDRYAYNIVEEKNRALKEEFEKLRAAGYTNIHYLSSAELIGLDGEATVDGIHLTDLGFLRMAEKLYHKFCMFVTERP